MKYYPIIRGCPGEFHIDQICFHPCITVNPVTAGYYGKIDEISADETIFNRCINRLIEDRKLILYNTEQEVIELIERTEKFRNNNRFSFSRDDYKIGIILEASDYSIKHDFPIII